jgi:hypothetical protein
MALSWDDIIEIVSTDETPPVDVAEPMPDPPNPPAASTDEFSILITPTVDLLVVPSAYPLPIPAPWRPPSDFTIELTIPIDPTLEKLFTPDPLSIPAQFAWPVAKTIEFEIVRFRTIAEESCP